jgi:AP endonuclease-1
MSRVKRQKLSDNGPNAEKAVLADNCENDENRPLNNNKSEIKLNVAKINPLRNLVTNHWLGAHVSAAKGPQNAIINSDAIAGNSFAMFLKNQRRWVSPPLAQASIDSFQNLLKSHSYDSKRILPHGSYLINLANPAPDKRQKSYEAFLDDLQRCETLGIELYNFHPGSTLGKCTTNEAIGYLTECINKAISATQSVTIVVENMAGQGNIIGSNFEELATIIDKVDDKTRIGVCIDTCHAFAAGYDLRTKTSFKQVFDDFDRIVGFKYLKAMHMNDSKGELGCCKDRHENIGLGKLGIECFRLIMNDKRFEKIPLILETPLVNNDESIYLKEIQLLYSLIQTE